MVVNRKEREHTMEKLYVETVFTTSGIPTYTYVEPSEYNELLVAVRTPGKCIVVEGPSGIGKTTAVIKVLNQLGLSQGTNIYSARKSSDIQAINNISNGDFTGTAIVDDFHRLSKDIQARISDVMKVLADENWSDKKNNNCWNKQSGRLTSIFFSGLEQ